MAEHHRILLREARQNGSPGYTRRIEAGAGGPHLSVHRRSQQGTCSVQMDLQDGRDRGLMIKLIQKRCTSEMTEISPFPSPDI